jgi:hypothetical protein
MKNLKLRYEKIRGYNYALNITPMIGERKNINIKMSID